MFCYSTSALSCSAPLFRGAPELFRRSAGVPCCSVVPKLFRRFACVPSCSGYSAGVPRSVVPCSGVPAFIVCLKTQKKKTALKRTSNDIFNRKIIDLYES